MSDIHRPVTMVHVLSGASFGAKYPPDGVTVYVHPFACLDAVRDLALYLAVGTVLYIVDDHAPSSHAWRGVVPRRRKVR